MRFTSRHTNPATQENKQPDVSLLVFLKEKQWSCKANSVYTFFADYVDVPKDNKLKVHKFIAHPYQCLKQTTLQFILQSF